MQQFSWVLFLYLTITNVLADSVNKACQSSRIGGKSVAFVGTVLWESDDGKTLKLRIEEVIQDVLHLISPSMRKLEAELPDRGCRRFFRKGDRVNWVGSRQWVNRQHKFVVRIYNSTARNGELSIIISNSSYPNV